jgi:RNA-binding protein YlmH
VTATAFLTPAEQAQVAQYYSRRPLRPVFCGGHADCERRAAFFLPDWMEESDFDPGAFIRCIQITAYYGTPGHRDYLGALLALGVRREWLGDIWVRAQEAWVFCLPSVAGQLSGLEQAGRVSVKAREVPLSAVPSPEQKRKTVHFTVQSPRLDAVLSEIFRLSRSSTVKLIAAGAASRNHLQCLKNDAPISEGDVLSLKGHGKAAVTEIGGESRKGRTYVTAEIYL